MAIRIKSRPSESAEQMLRRFKKMCEKEGLTKDLKKKAHYEKPSERRRRAKRKSENRAMMLKKGFIPGPGGKLMKPGEKFKKGPYKGGPRGPRTSSGPR